MKRVSFPIKPPIKLTQAKNYEFLLNLSNHEIGLQLLGDMTEFCLTFLALGRQIN